MKFLTKKYHPNHLQARVELRKKLGNLKLSFHLTCLKSWHPLNMHLARPRQKLVRLI